MNSSFNIFDKENGEQISFDYLQGTLLLFSKFKGNKKIN